MKFLSVFMITLVLGVFIFHAVIRGFDVKWEITVKEPSGRENRIQATDVFFGDTSLVVRWNSGNWPNLYKPVTLEVLGVRLVPIKCPITCR